MGMLAGLALLRGGFELQLSPFRLLEHKDVTNLVGLAILAAFCTEAFFIYLEPKWLYGLFGGSNSDISPSPEFRKGLSLTKVMFVSSNYVDIVAFMPVVWRLYQVE